MIGAMAEPPSLDAPVAGLGDADALAKSWLLELIAARPLGEAARLPTERMGVDGSQARRRGDRRARLRPRTGAADPGGRPRRPRRGGGSIAGAGGPAEVVAALERLRSVVWAAIERTAPGPPPLHLASRLAHVCATVAEAALAAGALRAAPAESPRDDDLARIRVARTGEGPLWVEALERQLADGSRSGRRFTLLLVDLDVAEHLRLAGADEAAAAFAQHRPGRSRASSAAPMSSPTRTTAASG